MGLKHHTVIFVPHARARFRKWRVTNRQLTIGLTTLGLVFAASIFTTWSYFTNTIDRQELERIREENSSLREVNQSFEGSIRELQNQLSDYEERTRQLAIVAGLDPRSQQTEPGIGGKEFDSSSMPDPMDDLNAIGDRASSLVNRLNLVAGSLAEKNRRIDSTPAISPVRGIITSGFGYRSDPIAGDRRFHPAIDIGASPNREVLASAGGLVVRAGRLGGGMGNAVYLSHGFGVLTKYGHLASVEVLPGDEVKKGQIIGRVGNSGRATGYHLHYEVVVDGKAVNPLAYMLDRGIGR